MDSLAGSNPRLKRTGCGRKWKSLQKRTRMEQRRMHASAIGAAARVVMHRAPFMARTTRPILPNIGRAVEVRISGI